MAQNSGDRDTGTDLAYLIVAGVGMVLAARIWSTKVKPWAQDNIEAVRTSGVVAEIGGYSITTVDIAAALIFAVPVLLLVGIVRLMMRHKKATKAKTKAKAEADAR